MHNLVQAHNTNINFRVYTQSYQAYMRIVILYIVFAGLMAGVVLIALPFVHVVAPPNFKLCFLFCLSIFLTNSIRNVRLCQLYMNNSGIYFTQVNLLATRCYNGWLGWQDVSRVFSYMVAPGNYTVTISHKYHLKRDISLHYIRNGNKFSDAANKFLATINHIR